MRTANRVNCSNSANDEQCEQFEPCEQCERRTVRTVRTMRTVRTTNSANSSRCANNEQKMRISNSSFFLVVFLEVKKLKIYYQIWLFVYWKHTLETLSFGSIICFWKQKNVCIGNIHWILETYYETSIGSHVKYTIIA